MLSGFELYPRWVPLALDDILNYVLKVHLYHLNLA